MKKTISTMVLAMALAGCDDASKAIDQAQEAANKAIDTAQEQMESVEDAFNLVQFGDAAESAEELAASVEEAMNVDFSDPQALIEAKEHIANAYACLVEASSESTVDKVMDKVMSSIGSEETKSLIKEGIEKAQAAKECVM
ncbi:MAG: hypothetical protein VYC54_09435 [Pseudomonadota bacterium]|nr:hypothetical protein [Pseudomonadota bacterium]